jgi:hypothetical protein
MGKDLCCLFHGVLLVRELCAGSMKKPGKATLAALPGSFCHQYPGGSLSVLHQVFSLSDRLKTCGPPQEVDLPSDRAIAHSRFSSPITAAGPPRIYTAFRDGEKPISKLECPFETAWAARVKRILAAAFSLPCLQRTGAAIKKKFAPPLTKSGHMDIVIFN